MIHAFISQSCGKCAGVSNDGRTVTSSDVGGERGRGYNNRQAGNRVDRVIFTDRGITDWIPTPTDKRQNLTPGAKGRIQPNGCIRPGLFSKVLDQTFLLGAKRFTGLADYWGFP